MTSAPEASGVDTVLAARLTKVHRVATAAAVAWVVLCAIATYKLSDRILSDHLKEAASAGERDAKAVAGVVNRVLGELEAVARVLADTRELHAIVDRYSHEEGTFSELPLPERVARLKRDVVVQRVGSQLNNLRDKLHYDQVYALDSKGIRVVTTDWDKPRSLLGQALADREYFQEAMADRSAYMFGVGRTTKTPVIFFAAPVMHEGKPVGAVVVRQEVRAIGAMLAGGEHVNLIVDRSGMVVASSMAAMELRHVGLPGATPPDAKTLLDVYALQDPRPIPVRRPPNPLHVQDWQVDGKRVLLSRASLGVPDFHLLVLSPLDWVTDVRPLHYAIGTLAALFGVLGALLGDRRSVFLIRKAHGARILAALNEKLKLVNADKDRYLGIAAHDLRNPLSSMRGLAELMLAMPMEPEQQKEFLETIHRTSDEMLGLVNDLLDVAVIESGKLDLRLAEQDVSKLVGQRLRHLEPHARKKQIALAVDAAPDLRASVDSARFGQVVDNLVSNAIKFSPAESTVRVVLGAPGGEVRFSVEDQGPGIPEQERQLLFRSFQKLSARPTGGEKSTGLGLAIVKRIVDAHHGRIDVDSEVGRGTRFTVTVPAIASQGS